MEIANSTQAEAFMFLSMAFTLGVVLLYVSQVVSHRAAISELQGKRKDHHPADREDLELATENN